MRLTAALLLSLVAATASAQVTGWLPVASYVNDPAHEAQAARATALLDAHHIQHVTTCSVGCTLSVDAARYPEASTLVRDLIAREHLDLSQIVPGTS